MTRIHLLRVVVICCALFYTAAPRANTSNELENAKAVFADFYKAMGEPYHTGLPDDDLQKKLQPYLSSSLAKRIKETTAKEAKCIDIYAKINDDAEKAASPFQAPEVLKPPLIEYSIFVSQYEPPEQFKIIQTTKIENKIMLTVEYGAYDGASKSIVYWKNSVLLAKEKGFWKIDDVADEENRSLKSIKKKGLKSDLKAFPSCDKEERYHEKNYPH